MGRFFRAKSGKCKNRFLIELKGWSPNPSVGTISEIDFLAITDLLPNILGIGRARKIWVVQKPGTPEEDSASAFALPVIGRKNWSDVIATVPPLAAP